MPNAAALAAEFVPANRRPIAVTIDDRLRPARRHARGAAGHPRAAGARAGARCSSSAAGAHRRRSRCAAAARVAAVSARQPARLAELVTYCGAWATRSPADATSWTRAIDPSAARRSARCSRPLPPRHPAALGARFSRACWRVYLGFSWLRRCSRAPASTPGTANTGITAFNLGGVAARSCGGWAIARFGSRAAMLTMCGAGGRGRGGA